MGAFGDSLAAYVQPLIDATDGSMGQVEKAFMIGQLCWNYAVAPEDSRDALLQAVRVAFKLDDKGYEEFKTTVIQPMFQRHRAMFPQMHGASAMPAKSRKAQHRDMAPVGESAKKKSRIGRNAACPCNSGKKYKRCCGQTS